MTRVLPLLACLLLLGCGGGSDEGPDARAARVSPLAVPLPASYRYELTASCGERALIGRFAVVVRDGEVTSVRA